MLLNAEARFRCLTTKVDCFLAGAAHTAPLNAFHYSTVFPFLSMKKRTNYQVLRVVLRLSICSKQLNNFR